jgi:hypothetical protein
VYFSYRFQNNILLSLCEIDLLLAFRSSDTIRVNSIWRSDFEFVETSSGKKVSSSLFASMTSFFFNSATALTILSRLARY